MPDAASLAALRAAVGTIVPPDDDLPGAVSLGVDRHVAELIEQALPGYVDLIAALLNAFAAELGGEFVSLDAEARTEVLKRMSVDESQDIRDAADALLVFSYGGTYSEWSGLDKASRTLTPPPSWGAVGYHGPVLGHPDFREDLP